jgi:toxin ParE1/3/4
MPNYELAAAAEEDLRNISRYTISTWGREQAARYIAQLDTQFELIGDGRARTRSCLPHRPELRVSRAKHHYIFFLERETQCPLILAVLHEKMDLMTRLRQRLEQ